ncbi:MAG TPA: hypothetical protein VLE02_00910 [Nitrosarchaeum sp.]|nr:hypothetical protein [Nitrosarchaeum sp.]
MNQNSNGPLSSLSQAFEDYISGFIKEISSNFDIDEGKLNECYKNYSKGMQIKKTANKSLKKAQKEEPKKSAKESEKKHSEDESEEKTSAEEGTCEREIKYKSGKKKICSRDATKKINGKFYCGTETTGCYQLIIGVQKKKVTFQEPENEPSKVVKQKITDQVVTQLRLSAVKISGKIYYLHSDTGVLFDKSNKPIGSYNEENKKVSKLDKEQIKFLEKNNIGQEDSSDDVSSDVE